MRAGLERPLLPAHQVHARVSARGSPVLLVDCVSTGHITVAMASCPWPAPKGAAYRGSCLFRLALSASSPGDFRPVTCTGWLRPRPAVLNKHRRGPSHCALA